MVEMVKVNSFFFLLLLHGLCVCRRVERESGKRAELVSAVGKFKRKKKKKEKKREKLRESQSS